MQKGENNEIIVIIFVLQMFFRLGTEIEFLNMDSN